MLFIIYPQLLPQFFYAKTCNKGRTISYESYYDALYLYATFLQKAFGFHPPRSLSLDICIVHSVTQTSATLKYCIYHLKLPNVMKLPHNCPNYNKSYQNYVLHAMFKKDHQQSLHLKICMLPIHYQTMSIFLSLLNSIIIYVNHMYREGMKRDVSRNVKTSFSERPH